MRKGQTPFTQPDDASVPAQLLIDGRRVGVWRFGAAGGWPLVWCHGGLICGMDAKVIDVAGRRRGVDIVSIVRPGIGRSGAWRMSSIAAWPHAVAKVADLLQLDRFAVAGWSGGGPYALACAAAMPRRVRAAAMVSGMAPLARARHFLELGLWTDRLLIPTARCSPWLAAASLRLGKLAPDGYLAWEVYRGSVGSRDVAALEPTLPWLIAAVREATRAGVSGMVDEYQRYYGGWGFGPAQVGQSVTVWQGEQDKWLPMSHARRLASA